MKKLAHTLNRPDLYLDIYLY